MFSNAGRCFRIIVTSRGGRVAQLGEHLLCKQGVGGSSPLTSTNFTHILGNKNFTQEFYSLSFSALEHDEISGLPQNRLTLFLIHVL